MSVSVSESIQFNRSVGRIAATLNWLKNLQTNVHMYICT